jgi:hypothetical protein
LTLTATEVRIKRFIYINYQRNILKRTLPIMEEWIVNWSVNLSQASLCVSRSMITFQPVLKIKKNRNLLMFTTKITSIMRTSAIRIQRRVTVVLRIRIMIMITLVLILTMMELIYLMCPMTAIRRISMIMKNQSMLRNRTSA